MNTEKNMLFAFLLNFVFSVFEFIGGIFTGSVAILSDAIHDIGDAASLGIAFFLAKKSKRPPDEKYTYGYTRYAIIGSVITTLILLFGSVSVIYNAATRIIFPTKIYYDGMIIFAIVGVCVNFGAALLTKEKTSLHQKAVNLHMLEDVLGWFIVLIGAIVMRFTNFYLLDPLMSIGVAIFILVNAIKTLHEALVLFLERVPRGIDVPAIQEQLGALDGVVEVHHVHVWSMDEQHHYATMHVVTSGDPHEIKERIRLKLKEHDIDHVTLELEAVDEHCHEKTCHVDFSSSSSHDHHHHHHHH